MKKEIEKLKKGCGESWFDEVEDFICGKEKLCPICKAKLEQAEKDEKKFKDFIKEFKEIIKNNKEIGFLKNIISK